MRKILNVALAGILVLRPRVLILDEPTAGQDPQSRRRLLARILAWQNVGGVFDTEEETSLTLIIISHALEELVLVGGVSDIEKGLGQTVERLVMLKEGQVVG